MKRMVLLLICLVLAFGSLVSCNHVEPEIEPKKVPERFSIGEGVPPVKMDCRCVIGEVSSIKYPLGEPDTIGTAEYNRQGCLQIARIYLEDLLEDADEYELCKEYESESAYTFYFARTVLGVRMRDEIRVKVSQDGTITSVVSYGLGSMKDAPIPDAETLKQVEMLFYDKVRKAEEFGNYTYEIHSTEVILIPCDELGGYAISYSASATRHDDPSGYTDGEVPEWSEVLQWVFPLLKP